MSMTPTLAAHLTSARACHPHTRSSQAWADPWAGRYAVGRCTEGHSGRQCQELTHAFPAQNPPRSSTAQILLCNAHCRGGVSVAPDIGSTLLGAARARDTRASHARAYASYACAWPHGHSTYAYSARVHQNFESGDLILRGNPADAPGPVHQTHARHIEPHRSQTCHQ